MRRPEHPMRRPYPARRREVPHHVRRSSPPRRPAASGRAAHSLIAVLLAAGAFGTAYNTIVAVTVLWGTRLNPDRPSAGVAAAAGANAIGLLTGALAGGIIADAVGLSATLLIGGAIL